MEMSGEYRIPAPREKVWLALNDPEILKQAIPGCDELTKNSDDELEAKVTAKVGPVKAKFGGHVRLENINAPESYSIVGEGKGGAAGFALGGPLGALLGGLAGHARRPSQSISDWATSRMAGVVA